MDNPEMFETKSDASKRDTKDFLEYVKDMLPWSTGERILDIGCGPGDVTSQYLSAYLSKGYELIGCDISEEMIKHAQKKFGSEQVSFKQVDIGDSNIFATWEKEIYDKIFSFYCLHWVTDLPQAAKNMCDLLKRGGYLVAMFTHLHPFSITFELLHAIKKWHPYTEHLDSWKPLFDPKIDVRQEVIKILKYAGFDIIKCFEMDKYSVHASRDRFLGYFKSVDPFISGIPEEKKEEYLKESENLLMEQGLTKVNEKNQVTQKYKLMYLVAKKH